MFFFQIINKRGVKDEDNQFTDKDLKVRKRRKEKKERKKEKVRFFLCYSEISFSITLVPFLQQCDPRLQFE
jgi:hypothetical protein